MGSALDQNINSLGNFSEATKRILLRASENVVLKFCGPQAKLPDPDRKIGSAMSAFMKLAESSTIMEKTRRPLSRESEGNMATLFSSGGAVKAAHFQARAAFMQTVYGKDLPEPIWECCRARCFAKLAMDPENVPSLMEIRYICLKARNLHDVAHSTVMVHGRRRGVGGSSAFHASETRRTRTAQGNIDDPAGTDRVNQLLKFRDFCESNLSFLRGMKESDRGAGKLPERLCMQAIACILGCSLNFLYYRRRRDPRQIEGGSGALFDSLVDLSGMRQRQHRRTGSRYGYPGIADLPKFDCGCEWPCWESHTPQLLHRLYDKFAKLSLEVGSQRKEHQHLLNVMWLPLSNSVDKTCDNALSALYTVSTWLISKVRAVLQRICNDPEIVDLEPDPHGLKLYREHNHPMNKLPHTIRRRVEQELDIVSRADPGAADNAVVLRIYNPEINTHEKLAQLLLENIHDELSTSIHPSTIRRIVHDYLEEKGFRISFTDADHNACSLCKEMTHASFRFNHSIKRIEKELSMEGITAIERQTLLRDLTTVKFQEKETLEGFGDHRKRHFDIRQFLNTLITKFKEIENCYRASEQRNHAPFVWCSRPGHALITHSDESKKIDLPSITVDTSCDITRFRFDCNANCNPVTDNAVVLTHEQGAGQKKNASTIIQTILSDHLINCRGEGIKIILADCAAVGRCWMITVCLTQYLVDQGLANAAILIYFENRHGKYLADQLFGQLQRRLRKSTVVGIDAFLAEAEKIKKKRGGKVSGFAINPLSCVDFEAVFRSLGYCVTPHPDFGFSRRNIHFAVAARPCAREYFPPEVLELLSPLMPETEGMVRLSSEPPGGRLNDSLRFEKRFVDVPAAVLPGSQAAPQLSQQNPPVVVALDTPFASSGHGVVSVRTTEKVGYNGFEFRKNRGFPELNDPSSRVVKEAWPPDMIGGQAVYGTEVGTELKCAPANWVLRKPVSRFAENGKNFKARYPPRNLLNATVSRGPRREEDWIPVSTYPEPPFPICENTSAKRAMSNLQLLHTNLKQSLHFLDVLGAIFADMDEQRKGLSDPWHQYPATHAPSWAVQHYRNILDLSKRRYVGHPKQPRSVEYFFSHDEEVIRTACTIVSSSSSTRRDVIKKMFTEAKKIPGGLETYKRQAEKDEKRYAEELSVFRSTTERLFDEENGLLPAED